MGKGTSRPRDREYVKHDVDVVDVELLPGLNRGP